MSSLVPMRPANFASTLSAAEQNALTWHVLSGCPRREAFLTFVRPDMIGSKSKAAVEDFIKQFFARKEVKEYLDAYNETLELTLHSKKVEKKPDGGMTIEQKRERALNKLVEYVLGQAESIDTADDPKAILDYANKIGVFDTEETVDEEPRRYIPESCDGCRYRQFCEDNTVDMCQYCKYRHFSEENGKHFSATEQLDIPAGTDFEEHE